jgi:sugar O-acyltransferase (sialic acid O-acetyltransferase NeuD family)
MKKIIIFGASGNCIDILDTLNDINTTQGNLIYECVGFLDDNPEKWNKSFHGVKVLGPLQMASELKDCSFVFGIGSTSNFWKRRDILTAIGIADEYFETIIHPTASVSRMAVVGRGTVIFQNATITSNAIIGNHVYILPNSVISHDDVIGDYTSIAGGVCMSGGVMVGHSCYLGTNSSIIGNIKIGNYCLVGMGSVVLDSIDDDQVVVGSPARYLRKATPEKHQIAS